MSHIQSTIPPAHVPCPPEDIQGDGRWHSVHQRYCNEARVAEPDVLFVGDSIIAYMLRFGTIWQRWFAPLHSLNFGIGGDSTQHLLWRLQNGELDCIRPKAIVVLIGTNNFLHTAEEVASGINAVVATIRERQPQAKIFLCTLLPRGQYPNRLREKNRETNNLLKTEFGRPARGLVRQSTLPLSYDGQSVTKKSRSNSGSGMPVEQLGRQAAVHPVELIDIDAGFVQADGTISHKDLYDYLHLTEEGYEKAFANVYDALREYLRVDDDDIRVEEAVFRSASFTAEEGDEKIGLTMADLGELDVGKNAVAATGPA